MGNWRTWGAQAGGVTLVAGALALALVAQGGAQGRGRPTPDARAKAAPPCPAGTSACTSPASTRPGALGRRRVGEPDHQRRVLAADSRPRAGGTSTGPGSTRWSTRRVRNGAQPLLVLGQTPAFALDRHRRLPTCSGTVPDDGRLEDLRAGRRRQVRHAARLRDLARAQRRRELARHAEAARRARGRGSQDHPRCSPEGCRGVAGDGAAAALPDAYHGRVLRAQGRRQAGRHLLRRRRHRRLPGADGHARGLRRRCIKTPRRSWSRTR